MACVRSDKERQSRGRSPRLSADDIGHRGKLSFTHYFGRSLLLLTLIFVVICPVLLSIFTISKLGTLYNIIYKYKMFVVYSAYSFVTTTLAIRARYRWICRVYNIQREISGLIDLQCVRSMHHQYQLTSILEQVE